MRKLWLQQPLLKGLLFLHALPPFRVTFRKFAKPQLGADPLLRHSSWGLRTGRREGGEAATAATFRERKSWPLPRRRPLVRAPQEPPKKCRAFLPEGRAVCVLARAALRLRPLLPLMCRIKCLWLSLASGEDLLPPVRPSQLRPRGERECAGRAIIS